MDHDTMTGEDDRTGYPGQRFACYPAGNEALQELGVPAGGVHELVRLFVGAHAARLRQPRRQRPTRRA
jgi:hypothetical protein